MALTEGLARQRVKHSACDGGPGFSPDIAVACGVFLAPQKTRKKVDRAERNYPASVTLFTHDGSKNPAGWAVALEASMWAPSISLAAMGILVSGGYQLLKLWIISKFFLLGYIRSGDQVS